MGDALDDPEPCAPKQARAAGHMRSLGRTHVFVNCGNPDCFHNAELDVSRFPDDMTYNDLQPRLLCTVCDHRGADVGPSWLRQG